MRRRPSSLQRGANVHQLGLKALRRHWVGAECKQRAPDDAPLGAADFHRLRRMSGFADCPERLL